MFDLLSVDGPPGVGLIVNWFIEVPYDHAKEELQTMRTAHPAFPERTWRDQGEADSLN